MLTRFQISTLTSILKRSWTIFVLAGLFFIATFSLSVGSFIYYFFNTGYPHLGGMNQESITLDTLEQELIEVQNFAEEYAGFRARITLLTSLIAPVYQQIPLINVESQLLSMRADFLDSIIGNTSNAIESYEILRNFVGNSENLENLSDPVESLYIVEDIKANVQSVCGYSDLMREETLGLTKSFALFGVSSYLLHDEISSALSEASDRLDAVDSICLVSLHMADILRHIAPYHQRISHFDQKDLPKLTTNEVWSDLVFVRYKLISIQKLLSDLRNDGLHKYFPSKEFTLLESFVDVLYDSTFIVESVTPDLIDYVVGKESNFVVLEKVIKGLSTENVEIIEILENADSALSSIQNYDALKEAGFIGLDLNEIKSLINLVQPFVEAMPYWVDVFGQEQEVKYLVLGHSADELRGTGGFVSAIWLVTLKGLSDIKVNYFDVVKIDDRSRLDDYPPPPRGLEENMGAWVWLMRDVSWNPDFPSTAQEASNMFHLSTGIEVDGVIAVNQWFLADLVNAMDDIRVSENEFINSKNLIEILEYKTDQLGREYTDNVFRAVLENLQEVKSIQDMKKIFRAFEKGTREKNLMVFMKLPKLSAIRLIRTLNGAIVSQPGDFVFVVDSNVGWSKSDRNIERGVRYGIDLSDVSSPKASLTVEYVNHSDLGGPGCEPQWRKRGSDYRSFKNACYWNFLRIYLPKNLTNFSHEHIPLPEYSVPVHLDYYKEGTHSGYLEEEETHSVYGILLQTEAGDKSGHKIEYDLPGSLLLKNESIYRYTLYLQKQSGARNRQIEVEIVLPDNAVIQSLQPSSFVVVDSVVSFVAKLDRDVEIVVDFKK